MQRNEDSWLLVSSCNHLSMHSALCYYDTLVLAILIYNSNTLLVQAHVCVYMFLYVHGLACGVSSIFKQCKTCAKIHNLYGVIESLTIVNSGCLELLVH